MSHPATPAPARVIMARSVALRPPVPSRIARARIAALRTTCVPAMSRLHEAPSARCERQTTIPSTHQISHVPWWGRVDRRSVSRMYGTLPAMPTSAAKMPSIGAICVMLMTSDATAGPPRFATWSHRRISRLSAREKPSVGPRSETSPVGRSVASHETTSPPAPPVPGRQRLLRGRHEYRPARDAPPRPMRRSLRGDDHGTGTAIRRAGVEGTASLPRQRTAGPTRSPAA
jgi:hypothetical protein